MNKNNFKVKKDTLLTVQSNDILMDFLLKNLKKKNKNNVKSLLKFRQVSVNDIVQSQYNHPLHKGDKVSVNWNKVQAVKPLNGIEILHEDDDIIVIVKEAGLLSIASKNEQENTTYVRLKEYLKANDPKSKIFIVHRLDKRTSGVMIFAKNPNAQQILQTSWKKLVKERKYIAVVEGDVKNTEGTITSWLKENKAFITYSSPTPNSGKKAISHYKVLKKSKNFSMLEVNIDTGRKNQIRVHMQDIGHSVVGDKKYGSESNPINRLGLHALLISFEHPISGKLMEFKTNIPRKFNSLFK